LHSPLLPNGSHATVQTPNPAQVWLLSQPKPLPQLGSLVHGLPIVRVLPGTHSLPLLVWLHPEPAGQFVGTSHAIVQTASKRMPESAIQEPSAQS
jgi:hypothetical protein